MPGGFKVQVKGLDEVLKGIDVKRFEEDINLELAAFGEDVVRDAKDYAPVDEGFLKNSINSIPGSLKVEVIVNVDYAAYVEFGTRKFAAAHVATLPPNWQAFAAQFKGSRGGTFQQLVAAITAWAKRTGKIPESAAYLKALKILREGTPAQPFLFPAFQKNIPLLIDRLKALFK